MKKFDVLIADHKRPGIGHPSIVEADWVEVSDGCLVFWKGKGRVDLVKAFAAETWLLAEQVK